MYFGVVYNAWTTCKRYAKRLIIVLIAVDLTSSSYMRKLPNTDT